MINFTPQRILAFALTGFFYTVIAVVFTYPLIRVFDTQIPEYYVQRPSGNPPLYGDHLQIVANGIEHKNTILNLINNNPVKDKEFCIDTDVDDCKKSTSNLLISQGLSGLWPITILLLLGFDPIVATNLNIFMSFVLTGYASFLLGYVSIENRNISDWKKYVIAFAVSIFPIVSIKRIAHLLAGQKVGYLLWIEILFIALSEYYWQNYKSLVGKKKLVLITGLVLIPVYLSIAESFLIYYAMIYAGARLVYSCFEQGFGWSNWKSTFLVSIYPLIGFVFAVVLNLFSKLSEIGKSTVVAGRDLEMINLIAPSVSRLWIKEGALFTNQIYLGIGLLIITLGLYMGLRLVFETWKVNKYLFWSGLAIFCTIITLGGATDVYEYLYEYFPLMKFSRTPDRAMYLTMPAIVCLLSLSFSQIIDWIEKKNIENFSKNFLVVFCGILLSLTIIIDQKNGVGRISLTRLPEIPHEFEKLANGKHLLFLPYNNPDEPFGSLVEYYLANTDATSINGYHPFPKNEWVEFAKNHGDNINRSETDNSDFENLLKEQRIDLIVILRPSDSNKYYSILKIDFNQIQSQIQQLPESKKVLENNDIEIYSL